MQTLVCHRLEAVALAQEFNEERFLPYNQIKEGEKFPVSDSYDMTMATAEGRCRRLCLYNRLEYLKGQSHAHVAKTIDRVTAQIQDFECGCRLHVLFDPEASNDERVHHGHRSELFCDDHKHLHNADPHEHLMAAFRDNQRTEE